MLEASQRSDSGQADRIRARVVRIPLELSLAPQRAALLVRDDARPFALVGRWAGAGALVSSEPIRVAAPDEDPFELLDSQPPTAGGGAAAAGGGWFGYLGYELGRVLEPVGAAPPGDRLPPFELAFYDHLLRCDTSGRWWFEALWTEARAAALDARLRELTARAAGMPRPRPFATEPWLATPAVAGHKLAVSACRRRIYAGDLFQANVCVRLQSRLDGDPADLFTAAVEALAPDRAAFLAGPWGAVASLSPELFLERRGRRVRSAPIKGTRRRSPGSPGADAAAREELERSEKDRAENVMIVDLVRNDLGRVCIPGSIAVDALAEARPHTGVWHLVSEVSGALPPGASDAALVRAAFPPGSVTGAPKVAALNVISELESAPRGVYTGAIGFASPVAGLELSVAIRTFEFCGARAWLGVGGGIVADSDPSAEAAECATKAAPLLNAIGAVIADRGEPGPATEPPARPATHPAPRLAPLPVARLAPHPLPRLAPHPLPRLAPHPVPRPDPAAGVFETILVLDGRPVALNRHLSRLARSVRALYRASLPVGLAAELCAAAASVDRARMRVTARPGPSGVSAELELTPPPDRRAPVRLHPVTVPGGIGGHKWIDRRLLDALRAHVGGEPLLCDLDGLVLEAARANVFAVDGRERLLTPPADGRILPGVTRARVLAHAERLGIETVVAPLRLATLAGAAEVFVTGALGGAEPAYIDGGAPGQGQLTTLLGTNLRAAAVSPTQGAMIGSRKPR